MAEMKLQTTQSLIARVNTLIEELCSKCAHLDRLSIEQGQAVQQGEVELVLDVLKRREPVLRALAVAGEQLGAMLDDKACVRALGSELFREAKERLLELERIADGIRERDAEHHEMMKRQRDGLAEQLSTLGQKRSAMDAYSVVKGTPNPVLQDRRG
jgi:hypothetical protein